MGIVERVKSLLGMGGANEPSASLHEEREHPSDAERAIEAVDRDREAHRDAAHTAFSDTDGRSD